MDFSFTPTASDEGRLADNASYLMQVEECELRTTKSGDGTYLNMRYSILSGPCGGKTLWGRFNVTNPSEQAVRIGQEQLSRLCFALGIDKVNNTEQFLRKPFIGTVKKDVQGENTYFNVVRYAKDDGSIPMATEEPKRKVAVDDDHDAPF